jgi:hypothetical protein
VVCHDRICLRQRRTGPLTPAAVQSQAQFSGRAVEAPRHGLGQAALLNLARSGTPRAYASLANAAICQAALMITVLGPACSGPDPDVVPAAVRVFSDLPDDLHCPDIPDQSVPMIAADPRSERRSDDLRGPCQPPRNQASALLRNRRSASSLPLDSP